MVLLQKMGKTQTNLGMGKSGVLFCTCYTSTWNVEYNVLYPTIVGYKFGIHHPIDAF